MASKLQKISELANQTTQAVTRDANGWMQYLATASRLYKYPFDEQLLIYAQRPDATACASMELWNGTMRRWVKPGSKGIAVIRKDRRGKPSLEYVFDVADTRPVRGAREPYLWRMGEEHHPAVLAALEQRYGPADDGDMGSQIMEMARRAVDEVYRDHLTDLAYDTRGSLLEELDDLNLEVRFRNLLTASVQYTLLTRCGLDPMEYLEREDFAGISEFSTPAVLHHLGSAASAVSMEMLMEIGTAIRGYEREKAKNSQKNIQKPLAKEARTGYTTTREEFNTVKRESAEGSNNYGGADLHEGGRVPDPRPDAGWGGRTGGDAAGQVRDAERGLSEGASQRDVHLHAPDGQVDQAPAGDRHAGAGAGGQHREGPDETQRRERGLEGQGSDGVGAGGEQLHPSGRGDGAGGDRLQVNQGQNEAAGGQPAASVSPEPEEAPAPGLARFSLFPTVEEQVEAITEAQAEEKRQTEIGAPFIHSVSDAVVDRALTSGGNSKHSIERIVAFFQKNPRNEDAAAFLEKEYGVGGKGLTIARTKYAMWFDKRGIRICPGNNTYEIISVHLPWPAVAVRISQLLRDGMFASQEKIDAARENELDSLATRLANLRMEFSDAAKEKDYLHTVSEAYQGSRSMESTLRIKELLREPESRRRVLSELRAFTSFYTTDRSLLRSRPSISLPALTRQIADLDKPVTEFKAVDGFAPARATFITEDEIDQFLAGAFSVEGGKIRVYSYFMQGHDDKECASFLRHECGDAGHTSEGLQTWSDTKGIKFTRSDENSGADGYDTVHLNWNQAQKRIRDLIEKDRFLTKKERESLPEYDKAHLAQMIYHLFSHVPNSQHRPFTDGADAAEAVKQIRPLLETPETAEKLFNAMLSDFAPLNPDVDGYTGMMFAMRDMGAFVRGESPMFTPLPESALQAERRVKERNRKKGRTVQKDAAADTPEAAGEATGSLTAAARALASKRKPEIGARDDGQFSLFAPAQTAEPREQRKISDADIDSFLIEDLGDPDRKQRLYALFTGDWSDALIIRKLEQEYSRSRLGTVEGGFCTLADGTRGYAYFAKELRITPRPEGEMRHVSFEEMAAHIHQLIHEGRYLSPEELERYQKDHAAPEPEVPEAGPEKKYSLGYGYLGNGLTVWNSLEQEDGDYKTIAHIAPDRTVKFYVDDLPEEVKQEIQHTAATSDARISATQDAPVFSTPPQVPEQEREASRTSWQDEYNKLKEAHPDSIVLYQVGDFFEMYGEDAKSAASLLGLTLTTRPIAGAGRVEMCGIPAHALEQDVEKLRGQYDVTISAVDARTGERQTRAMTALDVDTVPYNFEFEYRQLSRLKADCEYFLGAGGRHEKHLSEGSVEAQVARMRELYDKVPEKPEWLTAEDIDRYEAQMTGAKPEKQAAEQSEAPATAGEAATDVQNQNYEITVTSAEALILARPMSQAGITPKRTVQENGDVTFSVAESEKDTVERLITKIRRDISKAAEAVSKPKKARRTRPELNYRAFAKLFPEIMNGEYRSMRLKAGPSFMPLHVGWIDNNVVALSHTYEQNGDLMYDPEMTFRVDRDKGTLEALTFRQDGGLPIYQQVYPEPGRWIPKLRSDLNKFADQWMKNITQQEYVREQAVVERDGEDFDVFFDPEGKPVTADEILMREADSITAQLLNDETYANARRNSDEQNSRDECRAAIGRIVVGMAETNARFYNAYYGSPLAAQRFRDHLFQTTYRSAEAEQAAPAPIGAAALYHEALGLLVSAVRGSSFYDYLRDRDTNYDSARTELDAEIAAMMEEVKEQNPDLYEAYHTLPKFREWLIEDILEQTYQDITDPRDAVERNADNPDAPAWVREGAATGHTEPEQTAAGTEIPLSPEAGPEPATAGTSERLEKTDTVPVEPDFAPNVEDYLNLKAQHPDKLVGVQVGEFMMFYGQDAEEAAPALGTKAPVLDIPGLGKTPATGYRYGWQAALKKLLEHGQSVVLARPDTQRGPDAPYYEIIKERDISEYIPLGKELTIDGRRMKVDSIDFANGKVSLLDMEMADNRYPIFREEPVAFVRECVEEAELREFELTAPIEEVPQAPTGSHNADRQSMEGSELEEAKGLIQDFFLKEYGEDNADFSDLTDIGLAYTTLTDNEIPIQVSVNLVDFSVTQELGGQLVEQRRYKTLRELLDNELYDLDFDSLIHLEGEPEELLANAVKAAREPEPAPEPEQVEIDGGRIAPPPVEYTYKVTGRVNAGAFDVVFEELHFGPELRNFHITDDNLGAGGQKTKYQNNIAAIRTLKQIEAEGRLATPEEQETLSRYVGWGGIAQAFDQNDPKWAKEYAELKDLLTPEEYESARSTVLNAHYTSPTVIKAMYQAVENMGLQPGTVLEPSMGIGNFFGLLPESMDNAKLYGVEVDSLTGRIARQLYQKADITISGFENTDQRDFYDLAVGNVPFGQYQVHDPTYKKLGFNIHNYFFAKTLDQVRPGGIVAFVTSRYTMDAKDSTVRKYLAERADLLGAIRLPNNAFKANAGTEVVSDIIFLQKRDRPAVEMPGWVQTEQNADGFTVNHYFMEHPEMVLGEPTSDSTQYGHQDYTVAPIPGADLAQQLAGAIPHLAPPNRELLEMAAPEQKDGKTIESIPADPDVRNFSFTVSKGKIYFRENSRMTPVELGKTPTQRVQGMIGIRDSARTLID